MRDRMNSILAVSGAFVFVVAMVTVGWVLVRPNPAPALATWADASGTGTPSATAAPTTSAPVVLPTTATPTPTKKVIPRPTSTKRPPAAEKPPAPQPMPTPSPGCTPTYSGPKAPISEVKAALTQAAARQYWVGVRPPPDLTVPLPTITVPTNLMKAFAWQESGWQSTIIACDGGIGTMQIMPGTLTQVNNRFGENFDVNTLAGNTSIGAAYIEWLIMYFGLYYFGQNFDLSTIAAIGQNGGELKLLDVVISAYNVGPGSLERAGNTLAIPNPSYVSNVKTLMTNCVCQSY